LRSLGIGGIMLKWILRKPGMSSNAITLNLTKDRFQYWDSVHTAINLWVPERMGNLFTTSGNVG
jgi:hypothetical protein